MDSQEHPPLHHPPHLQSLPPHHQPPPPHAHGSMVSPPPLPPQPHQPHQQEQPNFPTHNNIQQQQQNLQFPFNSISGPNPKPNLDYSDGSSSAAIGLSIEPAKKKRGRPRKYSTDNNNNNNNIALGLSPNPVTPISSVVSHPDSVAAAAGNNGDNPSKKSRGRPPGSGKKQVEAFGAVGFGFTPHLITVNIGEDISSKVMAFSQQGPRAVCILSANGAVSNVTLRQPAMGGGTVTYEGRFEIISLSGSFLLSESNGSRSRTGGLSVSLSGPDGRVLGGGVAGMLMAATPVQVVVGSFIAEGKKPKSKAPSPTPPSNMLNFGAPVTEASSPSQGASSDSSDENGGSPLSHEQGPFGNAAQPMHGMPTYWGQTM
ncbi:PREDICTED: AT-hook motif nuclear-localized protein 10-like [Nicotiana attenuata]|uniref:AT-hook motif nuclear-localized protein n=1 Tax=Nicotiana attenuata TaxID=49451 RepID=A0A1J6KID8_NICAT|nr:PREDICTED: AT-hook motif nuclear-localized protein 10-like [Nicotiana attenuata]OIT28404.1 at-hook motif nuclear-localized protein 10 [Nicotiana attenuata]